MTIDPTEAAKLLEAFKQAAEAKLPEKPEWERARTNPFGSVHASTEDAVKHGICQGLDKATAALRSVSMEDIQGE